MSQITKLTGNHTKDLYRIFHLDLNLSVLAKNYLDCSWLGSETHSERLPFDPQGLVTIQHRPNKILKHGQLIYISRNNSIHTLHLGIAGTVVQNISSFRSSLSSEKFLYCSNIFKLIQPLCTLYFYGTLFLSAEEPVLSYILY